MTSWLVKVRNFPWNYKGWQCFFRKQSQSQGVGFDWTNKKIEKAPFRGVLELPRLSMVVQWENPRIFQAFLPSSLGGVCVLCLAVNPHFFLSKKRWPRKNSRQKEPSKMMLWKRNFVALTMRGEFFWCVWGLVISQKEDRTPTKKETKTLWFIIYLEPQTTIYKWLFQLDDSKSLYRK